MVSPCYLHNLGSLTSVDVSIHFFVRDEKSFVRWQQITCLIFSTIIFQLIRTAVHASGFHERPIVF